MLDLVSLERDRDGQIEVISEAVPPLEELFTQADRILGIVIPENLERMVLSLLRETAIMPVTVESAQEVCEQYGSHEDARRAIEDLESLRLCDKQYSSEGRVVLFNPNIWAADQDYTAAALRAENGPVKAALTGLIEEVSTAAGFPETDVTSCEQKWIDYAVSQGLLLRSLVQTPTGERAFLFAPHMGRSAFDEPVGPDPSGHVRQLIGSMVFANRFASNRLFAPVRFLNSLIKYGEAGDATNIRTDYSMLETAGIVKVEKATKYHKFVLLQSDVAEQAVNYLDDAGQTGPSGGLRDQRRYRHPEVERARRRAQPGVEAEPSAGATENIMAALRQEIGRRRYGR